MEISHLSKKELSKRRLKVRTALDDWGLRLEGATLGLRLGTHTPDQVAFVEDEIRKLKKDMRELNAPAAKQLRWVGRGFSNH